MDVHLLHVRFVDEIAWLHEKPYQFRVFVCVAHHIAERQHKQQPEYFETA